MTDALLEDMMTTKEAAKLLGWEPDTLRKKREKGLFREGVHYVHPEASQYRWFRSALVEWLHKRYAKPFVHSARSRRTA